MRLVPSRTLQVCVEALKGFSHVYCQMVSTTRCSRKAAYLELAPVVGTVGRRCIPRMEEGRGASWVNWWSRLLHDFLQQWSKNNVEMSAQMMQNHLSQWRRREPPLRGTELICKTTNRNYFALLLMVKNLPELAYSSRQ